MAGYRAFLTEDSENYKYNLTYYHNPNRWRDNIIALDNPIRNVENWSAEIKYLNESNDDLSDDIKNLPNDTGGIYVFYVKGLNLSLWKTISSILVGVNIQTHNILESELRNIIRILEI